MSGTAKSGIGTASSARRLAVVDVVVDGDGDGDGDGRSRVAARSLSRGEGKLRVSVRGSVHLVPEDPVRTGIVAVAVNDHVNDDGRRAIWPTGMGWERGTS